jgi:hypothetical protein
VIEHFPWYDSRWLSSYLNTKQHIRQTCPDDPAKLEHFVESMKPLRTRTEFQVKQTPHVLTSAQLQAARERINRHHPLDLELHEVKSHGRFVLHNDPFFGELQAGLTGFVSEMVAEEVEPSYNFATVYLGSGVCPIHLDAPLAKWTLDICLDQAAPWPIYISDVQRWPEDFVTTDSEWLARVQQQVPFGKYVMMPGDGLIFSGSSQWHYREPIPKSEKRSFCQLAFLHFVPKGYKAMSDPANWARMFDLPGLAEACPGLGG